MAKLFAAWWKAFEIMLKQKTNHSPDEDTITAGDKG